MLQCTDIINTGERYGGSVVGRIVVHWEEVKELCFTQIWC
jgi:hypothetical protein